MHAQPVPDPMRDLADPKSDHRQSFEAFGRFCENAFDICAAAAGLYPGSPSTFPSSCTLWKFQAYRKYGWRGDQCDNNIFSYL